MHCTAVLGAETAGEAEQDPTPVASPPPKRPTSLSLPPTMGDRTRVMIAHPMQGKTPGKESEFDAMALGSQSGFQGGGGTEVAEVLAGM